MKFNNNKKSTIKLVIFLKQIIDVKQQSLVRILHCGTLCQKNNKEIKNKQHQSLDKQPNFSNYFRRFLLIPNFSKQPKSTTTHILK